MNIINQQSMTRKEFNQLNFKDKLKAVWNSGKFIDAHITSVGDSLITNLYKINLFHVEVVYSDIGTNIKEINSYKLGDNCQKFIPIN